MLVQNSVRTLRTKKGMTQKELAIAAGVGEATISEIENGRHLPRIDYAIQIARALGEKTDTVFWIEDEREGT